MANCGCKKKNCGELNPTCPSWEQIFNLLNTLQIAPLEAVDRYGIGRLSYAAASLFDPVNVGDNDPIIRATRKSYFLEQFGPANTLAALIAAETAIGSAQAELIVSSQLAITDNHTTPANILIVPQGNGSFTVSSGKTLTVSRIGGLENRQYFFGAGTTLLGRNAVITAIRLEWWAGATPPANAHTAILQWLATGSNQLGGLLKAGSGVWKGTGSYVLPNGCIIEGDGSSSDGLGATVFQLVTGSSATRFFLIQVGARDIVIRDCVVDALENATNPNCVPVEFYGQGTFGVDLFSVFGVEFDNVLFFRGKYGSWAHDNALGGWELEQIIYKNCRFIGQSASNYRLECVNGSLTFIHPTVNVRPTVIAFDFIHSGAVNIINPLINGESGFLPCVGGVPNQGMGGTCYRFTLSHGEVNIYGSQDEAMAYFCEIEAALPGAINFYGCLSQSLTKHKAAGSAFINIWGGTWYAHSITAIANSGLRVFTHGHLNIQSFDGGVTTNDLCGAPVASHDLCNFSGTGALHCTYESGTYDRIRHELPVSVFRPEQWDGVNNIPGLAIVDYTANSQEREQFFIGRADINGNPLYGYWSRRRYSDGRLQVRGDQIGPGFLSFCGVDYPNADISANSFHGQVLDCASITGDTNDYFANPAGTDDNGIWKQTYNLTSTGRFKVTGFYLNGLDAIAVPGVWKLLYNGGSYPLDFPNQDSGSVAGNRIITNTGGTVTLWPGQTGILHRIGTASAGRWRLWCPPPPDQLQIGIVPSNFNYVSTSTLANITLDKSINLLTNGKYSVEWRINAQAAVKGLKLDFGGGSASIASWIGQWTAAISDLSVQAGAIVSSPTTAFAPASMNVNNTLFYSFSGELSVTTAGTLIPRGAQTASDPSNSGIFGGSKLTVAAI